MAGQLVPRGKDVYGLRVYMGRDASGKRRYFNKTFRGKKREAEAALRQLQRDKDSGKLLEPSRDTLDTYLDGWLETGAKPRLRPSTYNDYVWLLGRYVRPLLGPLPLQKLTALDIQRVYATMLTQGLSPRTVQYTHRVLHNALEQAVKWRVLEYNPARHAELPAKQRREMKYLTDEEAKRFLAAARGFRHFALFALLLATGLRPSEALALHWQDVDVERLALRVKHTVRRVNREWHFAQPKTKASRCVVDYDSGLRDVLLAHRTHQLELLGETELVFCDLEAEPPSESNIVKHHFKPVLKRGALHQSLRMYDLRHTLATLLLLEGVHPKIVSERLGHSGITITLDTYTHVIPGMQRERAERLVRSCLAASGGATPKRSIEATSEVWHTIGTQTTFRCTRLFEEQCKNLV